MILISKFFELQTHAFLFIFLLIFLPEYFHFLSLTITFRSLIRNPPLFCLSLQLLKFYLTLNNLQHLVFILQGNLGKISSFNRELTMKFCLIFYLIAIILNFVMTKAFYQTIYLLIKFIQFKIKVKNLSLNSYSFAK